MNRASDGKKLRVVTIERRPLSEQQRGCQACPSFRQAGFEHSPPAGPNGGHHRHNAQSMSGFNHADTVGRSHPNHRQTAISPSLLTGVELTRIQCPLRAEPTAKHPHPIADANLWRWPHGVEHGPTAHLPPRRTIPHSSHGNKASCRGRRSRPRQPRRWGSTDKQLRRLNNNTFDRHRSRPVTQIPSQIIGRKQTPASRRPAGHCGSDGHEQSNSSPINLTPPHQP